MFQLTSNGVVRSRLNGTFVAEWVAEDTDSVDGNEKSEAQNGMAKLFQDKETMRLSRKLALISDHRAVH